MASRVYVDLSNLTIPDLARFLQAVFPGFLMVRGSFRVLLGSYTPVGHVVAIDYVHVSFDTSTR